MNTKEHPSYRNIFISDLGYVWELYEGSQYTKDINKRYPQCIRGNIHLDKYGYEIYTPRISTCRLNTLMDRKKLKVHQLVAQTWISNPYKKKYIDHINYIKIDNSYSNLRWVTLEENNKGKHRKCKNIPSLLRLVILRLFLIDNLSIKEVNKLTGVTCNTLSEAKRGDVWFYEWQEVQRLNYF